LNLKYGGLLSSFAFNCNLRPCSQAQLDALGNTVLVAGGRKHTP